jgi:hypothetical protein
MISLAAFLEGTGASFFQAAESGAMRSVVPADQLPAAINVVTGRRAAINVAGPPLGGALFGLARSLPFIADAVSYAFSTAFLLAMRTPFQEERDEEAGRLREQLLEGFRFLWHHPFLRVTTLVFASLGFVALGDTLALVVIAEEEGLSGAAVGALVASFGVGVLVGSAISPQIRRALPTRAVLLLELWMWPIPLLFVLWPNVYVLAASLLPAALAIPSTDSVVIGYQLALTPDRLVGRGRKRLPDDRPVRRSGRSPRCRLPAHRDVAPARRRLLRRGRRPGRDRGHAQWRAARRTEPGRQDARDRGSGGRARARVVGRTAAGPQTSGRGSEACQKTCQRSRLRKKPCPWVLRHVSPIARE